MPHIIITGGSQRLGLEMVKHFLQKQWQVSAISRSSSSELDQLACENLTVHATGSYHINALSPVCNLLKQKTVDAIVHNASLFEADEPEAVASITQLADMINVHASVPAYLNRQLANALKQSDNANIIQMTDIYVDNPKEQFANYCASKSAAASLALSFAKTLAPDVRVNCIAPGILKFLPSHSEQARQRILEGALLQREAGFEPIIKTIDYILETTFITGTTLKVDGGRSLCR